MTHIVTLIGIVVAAATAIIVGFLHRRQMRQIELYKLDPSVGLIPQPTRLSRFVSSNLDRLLGIGIPIVGIALQLVSDSPPTRLSVVLVAVLASLAVFNLVTHLVFSIARDLLGVIKSLQGVQARTLNVVETHVRITGSALGTIAEAGGPKTEGGGA